MQLAEPWTASSRNGRSPRHPASGARQDEDEGNQALGRARTAKERIWHRASTGVSQETDSSQDGTTPLQPGGPVSSLRGHNPKEGKGAALPFVMFLMSRLETDPALQMFQIMLLTPPPFTSEFVLTPLGVSHKSSCFTLSQGLLWLTFWFCFGSFPPRFLSTLQFRPAFRKSVLSMSLPPSVQQHELP